jgi:hypothetical protein
VVCRAGLNEHLLGGIFRKMARELHHESQQCDRFAYSRFGWEGIDDADYGSLHIVHRIFGRNAHGSSIGGNGDARDVVQKPMSVN